MKLNSIIVGLLISITLFSCKNEDKKDSSQQDNYVAIEKPLLDKTIFTVTLNAVVKEDDSFQIFYKYDNEGPFEEKKSFFIEFKGSQEPQDIVFRLPKDEVPYFLRLDFGTNKEQKQVKINNFKIDYLGKTFEAKGKDFFNYFYSNDLVINDIENSTTTPIVSKDGNYDPIFCSAEGLQKQIDLLLK